MCIRCLLGSAYSSRILNIAKYHSDGRTFEKSVRMFLNLLKKGKIIFIRCCIFVATVIYLDVLLPHFQVTLLSLPIVLTENKVHHGSWLIFASIPLFVTAVSSCRCSKSGFTRQTNKGSGWSRGYLFCLEQLWSICLNCLLLHISHSKIPIEKPRVPNQIR